MFCKKCKSLMMPSTEEGKKVMKCSSCGEIESKSSTVKISDKKKDKEKEIEVIEKEYDTDPITDEKCEKCGNDKAYYTLQQTRAADESPTKFLKCTSCGHTWRDYD